MSEFKFYGSGVPGVRLDDLQGKLIVVEAPTALAALRKSTSCADGWNSAATPCSIPA